jgi:hypothetical protein
MARRLLPLLTLPLLLAGCAGVTPFEHQTANERGGPGLFSGPNGKFVIYGK